MAKDLGYGRAITHFDVDRVYYPAGLRKQARRSEELTNELLRVSKERPASRFFLTAQSVSRKLNRRQIEPGRPNNGLQGTDPRA